MIIIASIVTVLVVLIFLLGTFYTVNEANVVVVTRFGRFNRVAGPGLHVKWPLIEKLIYRDSFIREREFTIEFKTTDNVFCNMTVAVDYRYDTDSVYDSVYQALNPLTQMDSYMRTAVFQEMTTVTLEEAFKKQQTLITTMKTLLSTSMHAVGIVIEKVSIVTLQPNAAVKAEMNRPIELYYKGLATQQEGQAAKLLLIQRAEGQAKASELHGEGVAKETQAIISSLQKCIQDFEHSVKGTSAAELLSVVMMKQYCDMLQHVGEQGKMTTLMLPHSPAGARDIAGQIRDGIVTGNLSIPKQ